MCNIAGYIGTKQAAPILVEMMKNQEGYCGGYYTGIATIHEGRLYTAKVLGDVETLLARTDALHFPGTTGIIHSRSASGGDWHWGHPFVSPDQKFAFVLNGAKDRFGPMTDGNAQAAFLQAQGYAFETEAPFADDIKGFPVLPNGNSVHYSEMSCLFADYYRRQESLPTHLAMERSFRRLPGEIVALGIHADEAGTISYAKYNMPMSVARTEDEVFLASFSICFPRDRNFFTLEELPMASSGAVTLADTRIHRFVPALEMGKMTPQKMHDAYEIVLETLRTKGKCTIGKLNAADRVLWGEQVDLRYPATYSILRQLDDAGLLQIHRETVAGLAPGLTAPVFTVSLKESR